MMSSYDCDDDKYSHHMIMLIMLMIIAMILADCVLLPRRLQYSNILMMKMIIGKEDNGDYHDYD